MKVAVLSDIHSNYHAFKACYEDAMRCGAEGFVFLGDYISDLAEPRKTMDLVYEIQSKFPTVCLRGNRERYILEHECGDSQFARGSKTGSLLFTYDHLRKKDMDFFRSLTISETLEIAGVQFEIAHAAMNNDRFYFDSNDGHSAEIFSQMKYDYLLTGHCHKQYIKHDADKTIINPGSVGIPQGGSCWPNYAMLEINDGDVSCQLREVTYDMAAVIHSQFTSGIMEYARYWAIGVLYDLITGEERVLKLLERVEEIGDVYDEEIWHSAAQELGMKFTEEEILALAVNTKENRR